LEESRSRRVRFKVLITLLVDKKKKRMAHSEVAGQSGAERESSSPTKIEDNVPQE
jgi:hypothetical protein